MSRYWVLDARSRLQLTLPASSDYRVMAHHWAVVPVGNSGGYQHRLLIEADEPAARRLADSLGQAGDLQVLHLEPARDGHYRNEYPHRLVVVRDGQVIQE